MSKTKKLLENLSKITDSSGVSPTKPEARVNSFTNRHYPNFIHKLPAIYDKEKRRKDEDGDEYVMIDRVYGSLYDDHLLQRDGTTYKGKLYKKRRLVVRKDPITGEKKNFYSPCTSTSDGRWFDNTGLPIEAPDKLEPEKVKTPEEIEEENRIKAEKAKNREAAILANLK